MSEKEKAQKRSSRSNKESISCDNLVNTEDFALFLLDALKKTDIRKAIKQILKEDYDKITDLAASKLDARVKSLKELVENKDARIKELEEEVALLKNKDDDQEQYSRRSSARFYGIPEQDNEDAKHPEAEVTRILNEVGLNPTIQRCHRVGPKTRPTNAPSSPNNSSAPKTPSNRTPRTRAIICQFNGQKEKREVMSKWKDIVKNHGITVNEDLTRIRAELAYNARELKRKQKILSTWTVDGKVLVKDKCNQIIMIRSKSDLTKFN